MWRLNVFSLIARGFELSMCEICAQDCIMAPFQREQNHMDLEWDAEAMVWLHITKPESANIRTFRQEKIQTKRQ